MTIPVGISKPSVFWVWEFVGVASSLHLDACSFRVGRILLIGRFEVPAKVHSIRSLSVAVLLVSGSVFQVTLLRDLFGFGAVSLGGFAWPFTAVLLRLYSRLLAVRAVDGLRGGSPPHSGISAARLAPRTPDLGLSRTVA